MQFSRLRATNWRNFSHFDVQLSNRAFLIGANASGKSNFLDIFRFLRDLAAPSGGGFQQAVLSRGGVSAIRNINARHPQTNVVIDVELSEGEETVWRYRIEFNQDASGAAVLRNESVWNTNSLIIERPDSSDQDDKARLRQTHLEQTFANKDFRDIQDFFRTITYSHILPQLIRDTERYKVATPEDPFGGDFLERMASENQRIRDSRIRRIQKALETAIPQLSELQWVRDEKTGIPHLRARYKNWRPQGVWQEEKDFSDGTLRLIALLWALQSGKGPLLLEEPELSLHPGIVRFLPQMMLNVQRERKVAPRQTIISTHSPEILSDDGIGADEVLLFQVEGEGTKITLGKDDALILQELAAGIPMSEIVLPRTAPEELRQLTLWAD